MSGGVDSSVSVALLKKQGFDVFGVFIKTWSPDFMECTWKDERLDAMRVCAKLGIPFFTLDLEKEYKEKVADYMIEEYKKGRTPNPDVMCNKEIKFGAFFDWAMKQGADYVATGHYAIIDQKTKMLAGIDKNKDQSYFLWNIKKEHLSKILFPVGTLEKSEVRKLAKSFDLPTATKKDSQGVCFLGKVDMKDFLKHYIKPKIGDVLNESGEKIGTHEGSFFVTLGERGGFLINKKTSNESPYFVVAKDIKKNLVFVSNKKDIILNKENEKIVLNQLNWLIDEKEIFKLDKIKCRFRYRQNLEDCSIKIVKKGILEVVLKNKQLVASGQSVVFYHGENCLGGGIVS